MKMRKTQMNRGAARRGAITAARRLNTVSSRVMRSFIPRSMPAALVARRGELNAVDLPSAVYVLNSTGSVTPLNLIRAGSTYVNRTGRRIEMQSIRISGLIEPVPRTNTGNNDYVRIIVVYDRQTNGANPLIADVLATTDQAATNTTTSFSGLNLNNRDRFQILMDYRCDLPSYTNTAGSITAVGLQDQQKEYAIDRFIKLRGMLTQFKADSSPAVIGDIATGGLFLITIGTQAAGAEGWQAALETRLRFTDTH